MIVLIGFTFFLLPSTSRSQTPVKDSPCSGKEHRQFDFWIGKWSIQARSRPPGEKSWNVGKSWIMTRVYPDLSGCAIIEESIDRVENDTVVVGKSLTSYNSILGKYQQMWVDNKGNVWEYTGSMEGEDMVLYLEHTTAGGEQLVPFKKSTQIRMVFKEISKSGFTWSYEYSTDGGKDWNGTNEAIYKRIE